MKGMDYAVKPTELSSRKAITKVLSGSLPLRRRSPAFGHGLMAGIAHFDNDLERVVSVL